MTSEEKKNDDSGIKKGNRQVTFAAGTDEEQSVSGIKSGTLEHLREDTFGAVIEEPAADEVEDDEIEN